MFGIYIHTPYCIQRCGYCDFATYEKSQIMPPKEYFALLLKEIDLRHTLFHKGFVNSIYFGGGTPSLVDPDLLFSVIIKLKNIGFQIDNKNTEITIEINPATIDENKLEKYLSSGFNRFSVGAQTFSNSHLKRLGREHTVEHTIDTLNLLKKHSLNFNFDLLFGLPNQTLTELEKDLQFATEIGAKHISPYCLTLESHHPLNINRPNDDTQIQMFKIIDDRLLFNGFSRYEISNYALPGFESKHNLLYWTDYPYWGIGLSSHSYLIDTARSAWGQRFWNVRNIRDYHLQIESMNSNEIHKDHIELLTEKQSLTDFCHTSLRMSAGLSEQKLQSKFSTELSTEVLYRLKNLHSKGLVKHQSSFWMLSENGVYLSNQVFLELTFI